MSAQSNEDLVRWALHTSATSRQEHYAALDALVAELEALAARLAEAEAQVSGWAQLHGDEHERAVAAEARVAALTEALRQIEGFDVFSEQAYIARAALAAADRPEGTTPC